MGYALKKSTKTAEYGETGQEAYILFAISEMDNISAISRRRLANILQ